MLKKLKRKGSKPLIVTSRGEPIAVIYPFTKEKLRRVLGGQERSMIVDEDFSLSYETVAA
jgi:antitoxin (DNA-binding transcriptional repressor) of toxin-antitoxin stability system